MWIGLLPLEAHRLPRSAAAIRNRTAEIMFGRPLDDELARLEDARRLSRNRWLNLLQPRLRHLAGLDLQIDGDETLARLDPSTRVSPIAGCWSAFGTMVGRPLTFGSAVGPDQPSGLVEASDARSRLTAARPARPCTSASRPRK